MRLWSFFCVCKTTTMVMKMLMMYSTDMKNYGSSMYREEQGTFCNKDSTTTTTANSRSAGTSVLHTNGYSNVAQSSTSFDQLQKVRITFSVHTASNISHAGLPLILKFLKFLKQILMSLKVLKNQNLSLNSLKTVTCIQVVK